MKSEDYFSYIVTEQFSIFSVDLTTAFEYFYFSIYKGCFRKKFLPSPIVDIVLVNYNKK